MTLQKQREEAAQERYEASPLNIDDHEDWGASGVFLSRKVYYVSGKVGCYGVTFHPDSSLIVEEWMQ